MLAFLYGGEFVKNSIVMIAGIVKLKYHYIFTCKCFLLKQECLEAIEVFLFNTNLAFLYNIDIEGF